MSIINVRMFYNSNKIGLNVYASPSEFLSLIDGAEYVFTNSYHGVVFSIIFNKQFALFSRKYSTINYSEKSRFLTLFEALRIKKEFIDIDNNVDIDSFPLVNYDLVNELINIRRKESITYLQNAISSKD